MFAHVFSDLVLCLTALVVFLVYFQKQPIYNRLLWGIFMMSISLTALSGVFIFAGWDELDFVRASLQRLELTLGAVCMVMASWALINRQSVGPLSFWGTIGVGTGIFLGLSWYGLGVMVKIIQPLCLVITLLIACLGLARRQKSALWVVFSMMLLALAAKSPSIPLPLHPIDVNHYLIALSTFCAGKAAQFEYSILFK